VKYFWDAESAHSGPNLWNFVKLAF
jgi:hypothetical protein